MFGIGLSELLVICCVILICVRPKDIPKLFRRLGRLHSRLRAYYQELASVPEQFLKDLQTDVDAEAEAKDMDAGRDSSESNPG